MDTTKAPQPGRRPESALTLEKPANMAQRGLFGSDLPLWIMLGLVILGLPRTILTDLGVLEAEGSLLYYVVALVPYAVWLSVAVLQRTRTPFRDHVLTGTLYGLSLVLVHELFWNVESSQGHNPPLGAIEFARGFDAPVQGLAIHGFEFAIAMMIGVGSGLVLAVVAFLVNGIRRLIASRRSAG